jgi:hypothetical protein
VKYYYVCIPPINGRLGFTLLAEKFLQCGILTAEYDQGGWNDYLEETTYPHLRFVDEQEAIMYILKFGGEVTTDYPIEVISK